ncbi:uncharacterized protein LOC127864929 [Dreissena polymorpha]|uniref:uncharacterized protein LOC127864929 n=1 Tax=Dreissena polymorpha TaxID=45954 RepID=UPI0022648DEE|nr:uncharacterized protein LOC127864929 [Dreissena polymorpha]
MASFSGSSIEKGCDFVPDSLCSTCKDKNSVIHAEFYCERCKYFFCRKCLDLHDNLFTKHNVLGKEHGVKWPVSREEDSLSQKFKVDSRPGRRAGLNDAVPGRRAGLDDAVPGRRAGLNDAVPGTRPIPHRVDKLKDNNTRDVYHGFTSSTSDNSLKPYTPSSIGASLKPADDPHSFRPTSDNSLKPYTPSSIGARPIPEWLKSPSTISVQGNPAKVFTVKGKSEHNVFIPSDSYTCIINAICVLPDGKVLVADSNNRKVKLLNQQYQVVSHCGVTAMPWDMCVITSSEVAVSVDHGIQFITVNKTQLVPARKGPVHHFK